MPSAASRWKKVAERVVVVLRLGDVAGGAAAQGARGVGAGGKAGDELVAVHVGDVAVGHRHARLLHVGHVAERLRGVDAAEAGESGVVGQERAVDLVAVQVDEVARGVGDLVAVPGQVGRARAELRGDVAVAEERLVAGVAARLGRQQIGDRGRRRRGLAVLDSLGASGRTASALRAVHRDPDVVSGLGVLERVRIGGELLGLGRVGPKTFGMSTAVFSSTMLAVETSPTLQPARVKGTHGAGVIGVGSGAGEVVAAGWPSRPWRGWCRGRGWGRRGVVDRVGPVGEGVRPGRSCRRCCRPGTVAHAMPWRSP